MHAIHILYRCVATEMEDNVSYGSGDSGLNYITIHLKMPRKTHQQFASAVTPLVSAVNLDGDWIPMIDGNLLVSRSYVPRQGPCLKSILHPPALSLRFPAITISATFFVRKIAFTHQLQSSSWQSCDLSVPFQQPGADGTLQPCFNKSLNENTRLHRMRGNGLVHC